MRYGLRTLLTFAAVVPPIIAGAWLGRMELLFLVELGGNTLIHLLLP
jgi:hypothetical protein